MDSCGARMMEPVMKVEITAEMGTTGRIGQDIMRKRGNIVDTEQRGGLEVCYDL